MTKNLALLLASFLLCAAAHAEPPSEASLDALFEASHARKTLDSVYPLVDQAFRQGLDATRRSRPLTPAQQKVLDGMPAKMSQLMREELSWDKMHPLYAQIYRETFTQEEVDGLVAFYKSPAGIALVNKMPIVLQKTMGLTQSLLGPLMQKMEGLVKQAIEEAKEAAPKPGA